MQAFASVNAGIVGLLFFFVFFLVLVAWLLRPGAKDKAALYARIPLDEDENNG